MTDTRKPVHVGGCQCGAVRYALYAEPTNPHVCHCRMCQKAVGGYFGAFAGVPLADFAWVKGEPGTFKSSELAERGFCRECGTPLSFRYIDRDRMSVSLGSLDDPARVAPAKQFGLESRLPFIAAIAGLPGTRTEDDVPAERLARYRSRQHPDGGARRRCALATAADLGGGGTRRLRWDGRSGSNAMPKLKLDHCVIHVSDWQRSNAFYRDVLGAELIQRGAGWAYRFGDTQLNCHGPGLDAASGRARAGFAGQQRPVLRVAGGDRGRRRRISSGSVLPSSSGPSSAGRPAGQASASISAIPTARCWSSFLMPGRSARRTLEA